MIIVVLLAMMLTTMGVVLYDVQINNGEDYYRQSQYKIAETETVESARGQILDRNGQVLVSNQVIYQVTLDTSLMGEHRNDILLSLIQAARKEEVVWEDTLPISKTPPFTFTTDTPYFTTSQDEEGNTVTKLTRLGKLAVQQKWIQDPTQGPEETTQTTAPEKKPSLWDKITSFFSGEDKVPEEPASSVPEEPYRLPTAEELLGMMCATFGLAGEGAVDVKKAQETGQAVPTLNIGDMPPEDARAVAGVLFELYYRSKVVNWPLYVFAEDVDIDFISRVREQSLAGVTIQPTTVRKYNTSYASHILGRVTSIYPEEVDYYTSLDLDGDGEPDYNMNDTVGRDGVEKAFESYLRGKSGIRTVERNTKGKIVSETWLEEPQPGHNVVLTLDMGLQTYVENTLANTLPTMELKEEVGGAACVMLDVNTAEVLACASYPTIDLANYNTKYQEYASNPLKPFNNRALQGLYAPGSTFKMITAIAGLEEGIITPETEIEDLGRYTYYKGPPPQCWIYREQHRTHGMVDVSKAIEVSCNYFFFDVGRQLGIDKLVDYATRFGLGQKTGIELYEAKGVMASPEYTESMGGTWYDGSTLSVAIGQESSQFTPIQLANYIATLVNGGTHNATHLLKEVKSSDFSQVVYTKTPQIMSTVEIKDENLDAVKAGMLALTTRGSVSRHFVNLPFQVGAKTGSAQVNGQAEANAVFVCFAPFDKPEVAIALVVEHGGSGSELGAMAADILSYYFSSQETRDEAPTENTLVR